MRPQKKRAFIGVARRLSDRLPDPLAQRVRNLGTMVIDGRGERKSTLRLVQYEVLRRATPVLAAPFGPVQLLVGAEDNEIGRTVFVTGGYERWHMEAAIDHLSSVGRPTAGKVFVDVGANIGTSTIDALVLYGFDRAVSFEPAVENLRLLRANLLWNGLDHRADVYPVALSDSDGTGVLLRSERNSGDQRFTAATCGVPGAVEEPAECKRLDSFVESGAIDVAQIGLVWIDAQGHEPNVLRGATRVLGADVPVVVEYCPWILGEAIGELDDQIARSFSSIVNLNAASAAMLEKVDLTADDLPALARRLGGRGHADLLLLP